VCNIQKDLSNAKPYPRDTGAMKPKVTVENFLLWLRDSAVSSALFVLFNQLFLYFLTSLLTTPYDANFEVFTAISMKTQVLWSVTPCSLVNSCQSTRRNTPGDVIFSFLCYLYNN
jgi:hypothetical protein